MTQPPKMVIVGDIHLADRPPSSRKDTYRDDILNKLRWIVNYTNEQEDMEILLLLGDVFHIKRPDRNSHYLVQETASVLGDCRVPVWINVGNHDITADRLESIPSQPLGTLALHPNIHLLDGPTGHGVYGVPYFDPTPENFEAAVLKYQEAGGPEKHPFIAAHESIFPKKEEPIYDYISSEVWAEAFGNKWTAYGHIHSRMRAGAFYQSGGSWFCNNGAISRGSLHEETIHRELAITVFDPSKDEPFTSVPIPYKEPEEVFDLGTAAVLKARVNSAEGFLQSLGSTELRYLTVEGILEKAKLSEELHKLALTELEDIIQFVTTK